jgi:hypothetical protein
MPDGDLHHLIRAMPAKGAHLAGFITPRTHIDARKSRKYHDEH